VFLDVFEQGPGIPVNISRTSSTAFTMLISHPREELSITPWVVQAHGGETGPKSEEGHGSTFRVSLPLAKYSSTGPFRKGSQ
jgi:nitrogen-specific signal transduction histidine kinase